MAAHPVRILLIQAWTAPTAPFRARLAASGYAAKIFRVDFEAALRAALSRNNHDIVLYDPATHTLARTIVEACMKEHAVRAPLLDLIDVETIGERIRALLGTLRN